VTDAARSVAHKTKQKAERRKAAAAR